MVYFAGGNLFSTNRPRGLPIGNLTSQFWANCCLSPFDHFVKRHLRCKGYLRYVDDFLLFANDKYELNEWREKIIRELCCFRMPAAPCHRRDSVLGFVLFPTPDC